MLLGCIADDLTGATDLGVTLAREGFGVVQVNGVPDPALQLPAVDAIVVALKSRTIPAADAVKQSLAALGWLSSRGAARFYFKYCSTFDSTPAGNIGPVADALLEALGADFTVATPAYPRNGRTIYLGQLFVGDVLLSESGMRDHPLTPMTDANLVRVLGRQTSGSVGLVPCPTIEAGVAETGRRLAELRASGMRYAILDGIRDEHLVTAGVACRDFALTTGGAGLAMGIARALRSNAAGAGSTWPARSGLDGRAALLAGSCSVATRAQVKAARAYARSVRVDPLRIAADPSALSSLVTDAIGDRPDGPVLVYSSEEPADVAAVHERLGRDRAATLVEDAFRQVAAALAGAGVRTFVVAGGETAGAVVDALGVRALAIGPEIDPGVPWTASIGGGETYWLALKSGNFGAPDFFARALALLP